jgi:hypothetical protein
MKKIVILALAAMLALSMTAFAGDEPKDTKSCDKAHKACCKDKDKKECKLDAKACKDAECEKHAKSDKSE